MTHDSLAAVGGVFAALYAAHLVADHWVQTQHQADTKGAPGWRGRIACAGHVVTYTVTAVVALFLLAMATGWRPSLPSLTLGLVVSAVTHYLADRRMPLRWLAEQTGSGRFYRLGVPRAGHDDNPSLGTGAYVLDQSWHVWWLFVSAMVIA